VIRPAVSGDERAIAEVHVRTWQGAYRHVFPAEQLDAMSVERRVEVWAEILADAELGVFVAEREGNVVGFSSVGASRDVGGEGELYGIYVLPAEWGSGAGGALMEAALDALRGYGYERATLWVLDDNPRARAFYEKHGWRPDGETKRGTHLGVETDEVRYRVSL